MSRSDHADAAFAGTKNSVGRATTRELPEDAAAPASAVAPGWFLALAVVFAGLAAAMTLTPYPPLQDFLEWAYQGKLLALLVTGADLGSIRIAPYPVPNSMTQVIMGLLSLVLPARLAALVFLLGFLAAASWVARALARRYQPLVAGPLSLVLLVSIFVAAPFWSGYSNYVFSLLLFGIFLLIPRERWTGVSTVLVFSVAIFFTHLTTFASFLLLVGVNAMVRRRIWPVLLGVLPSVLLACWYYVALDRGRLDPGVPLVGQAQGNILADLAKFVAYKVYTFAKVGPYHNFVFAAGGDVVVRPAIYWAGVLLNCAYALVLMLMLVLGGWDAVRRKSVTVVPVIAGILMALVFLLMPPGRLVANTGERFMYPALLLLLLFLPLRLRLAQALGAAAVLLLLGLVALTSAQQDWATGLPEADWEAPQRVLFQHRPTAFAGAWHAMEELGAGKPADPPQLSFETSLLISDRLGAPPARP